MKLFKKLLALSLALSMLLLASCVHVPPSPGPDTGTTTPPEVTTEPITPAPEDKVYNIVFALATIPPVLAALDCIDNGHETYAIIERGKTYSGIEKLENFHNAGFDPSVNLSSGFSNELLDAMVDKVKELKGENVFFNFYTQDGTALCGAAIAANAGLSTDDFIVYMCEDGTGAYNALRTGYINNRVVNATTDGIYDNYVAKVAEATEQFETVMGKTDNKYKDAVLGYSIRKAFALASLPNFVYYLQDESIVINALESKNDGDIHTKLLTSFGVDGYDDEVEYRLNLKYQKISEGISKLTEAERSDYLTLMYGDYFEGTYASLTRTEAAGKAVPAQKLVFIGSRHNGYPKFASSEAYGIGGITYEPAKNSYSVPMSYDALPDKYKSALLFSCEEDYNALLDILKDESNYPADTYSTGVGEEIRVAIFNLYIDYIFTLKLTYSLYGEEYDLIMKGHPREAIGSYEQWDNRYVLTVGEGDAAKKYVYDKLVDSVLLAFHESDSVGKYIGMVPYGTAAENLAYLGADIAICGLPSSTYSGYDTDVDVLFILSETNENISGAASQVKERYEAGNLTYHDGGEEKTTVFYNNGNACKAVAKVFEAAGDSERAADYNEMFEAWLDATHGADATGIDEQGFKK